MQKLLALFCASLLSLTAAVAAEGSGSKFSLSATETKCVAPDSCYVLFLLEVSAQNLQAAQQEAQQILTEFQGKLKKDFPQAKSETVDLNFGTNNNTRFRANDAPIVPTVTKAVLCTLPPDEESALKVFDLGLTSRLTPFCGQTDAGMYGAVYFAVRDFKAANDALLAEAWSKMLPDAQKRAEMFGMKLGRMLTSNAFTDSPSDGIIQFRDLGVRLPTPYFSPERNGIFFLVTLNADFELLPR